MNQNRTIFIASIYLFFTTLFWAGNFIVGKTASINEIPPMSVFIGGMIIIFAIIVKSFDTKQLKTNEF